jgi:hypothetical protein
LLLFKYTWVIACRLQSYNDVVIVDAEGPSDNPEGTEVSYVHAVHGAAHHSVFYRSQHLQVLQTTFTQLPHLQEQAALGP